MTDTMLERVARAICEQIDGPNHVDARGACYVPAARAALLAIREAPMDIGLIGAAEVNKQMRVAVKADYCAAQDSFTAMIDAILSGEA